MFEIDLENLFNSSESTDKINEIIYQVYKDQVYKNEVSVVENFMGDLISRCENRIHIIDQKNKKDQKENEGIVKAIDKTISDLQQIQFSFD